MIGETPDGGPPINDAYLILADLTPKKEWEWLIVEGTSNTEFVERFKEARCSGWRITRGQKVELKVRETHAGMWKFYFVFMEREI